MISVKVSALQENIFEDLRNEAKEHIRKLEAMIRGLLEKKGQNSANSSKPQVTA